MRVAINRLAGLFFLITRGYGPHFMVVFIALASLSQPSGTAAEGGLDDPPLRCLSNEQLRKAKVFVEAEMDRPLQLPCLRRVKADRLGLLLIAAGSTRSQGVAALYLPSRHEILIAEDLDLDDPVGASFIVHELVHVVQFAEGRHLLLRCPGQLEHEAYSKQALFLERRGHYQMALLMRIAGMMQAACGTEY